MQSTLFCDPLFSWGSMVSILDRTSEDIYKSKLDDEIEPEKSCTMTATEVIENLWEAKVKAVEIEATLKKHS